MNRWRPWAIALAAGVFATTAAALPDAQLDQNRLARSVRLDLRIFAEPGKPVPLDAIAPVSGNCVLDPSELCVGGAGIRKLLRFDVQVHSRGTDDIVVGDPRRLPELFEYSACHGHYHFAQASLYQLLDAAGEVVAIGRKQGFCLEDTNPSSASTQTPRRYNCQFQGIQVGWSDVYPAELDCQWIDVTDVPAGDYTLHVRWNPEGIIEEATLDNNDALVAVTLPPSVDPAPVVERVTRPVPSSVLRAGGLLRAHWSAGGEVAIATQEIWLSLDDGATWRQLAGAIPGSARSYAVLLPSAAVSTAARIKVVARDFEADKGEAISPRFRIQRGTRRLAVRPAS